MADETPVDSADTPANQPEEAPKPRRRRTRKTTAEKAAEKAPEEPTLFEAAQNEAPAAPEEGEKPAKPRRRRSTRAKKPQAGPEGASAGTPSASVDTPQADIPAQAEKASDASAAEGAPAPKPRRRRTRKASAVDPMTELTKEATRASSEPTPMPATTLAEADKAALPKKTSEQAAADTAGNRQHAEPPTVPADADASAQPQQGEAAAAPHSEKPGQHERANGQKNDQRSSQDRSGKEGKPDQQNQGQNQQNQGSREFEGRRRRHSNFNNGGNNYQQGQSNRHSQNRRRNRRSELPTEPTLTRDELSAMKVAELRSKASELGVEAAGVRKAALVEAIYQAAAKAEGFHPVSGILEIGNEGYGWVRTGNYMAGDDDAFVHQQLIKSYGLRTGDRLEGTVGPGRANSKYPPLISIDSVNGRPPEEAKNRPRFRDLTPIYPNEPLVMENGKNSITGRAIDLVAPIGKGQRGLIVSPPKAGKTTVLKKICQSIAANNPEVHLFCLLVDERPEEVTDMQRSIKGEVVASTFDMPAENHTAVSELVIEHAKRLVEQGEDVVVVLDSITRLARAYNLAQPASGRILSGGVDSAALYPPKKFLGAARNIENGGSLTIIASALVDTGSKMDEVIFEEFKGTGNMELKLDRDLADKRIFPAIDPVASGTRNEELLLSPELTPFIWGIRRVLANMNNTERAASALVKGLKATESNEEFLIRSARKAQQTEYAI
ncbi:MAG: transcription termination factor Rho [Tractidigestivibacter sp.]|uniref:transcription termination factor Rho n=1 Tax=Tractidigestivibacter sp. TaxID=2847320 RepID=UPI003D8CC67D